MLSLASSAINSILSAAELAIGITCLACTTYKPLFKLKIFHRRTQDISEPRVIEACITHSPRRSSATIVGDDDLGVYKADIERGQSSEYTLEPPVPGLGEVNFDNSSGVDEAERRK